MIVDDLTEIALEKFASGRALEPSDGLFLNLAHTLPGKAETLADFLEGHFLSTDAEEGLDDFPLPAGESGKSPFYLGIE